MSQSTVPEQEEDFSFLDVLVILAKYRTWLVAVPLAAGLLAAGWSLLLPNVYTATTRMVPPQQSQSSAAALLSQLGPLAGVAGPMGRNTSELYVGMLKSRTVADSLIQRFELQRVYGKETVAAARDALTGATSIGAGKEGIIAVDVEDPDPARAAQLANAYVEELYKLTQTLAVTEAGQRRLFFERQLKSAKTQLADAEVALKKTQEATGLVRLDDQGRAIIESIGRLRAQVVAKEVQLGAMRTFATTENPEFRLAQQELSELRAQLSRAENLGGDKGSMFLATGKIPESGLEYVRKLRDVKYNETIFELLAKQLEAAKIDEARDSSLVQVLDPAIPPEKKSGPRRTRIVLLTAIVAAVLVVLGVLAREAFVRARENPKHSWRIQLALRYLFGR